MDAATLSAAAAAIPTSRSARNAASAALAIVVDDSKSNLRTLKTLATALQTALGLAGYLLALISAGERMLIYDELHKEWIEAMDAVIDDDSDEQRHHKVYTMEIALQLASEEHACREYGPPAISHDKQAGSSQCFRTKAQDIPSVQGRKDDKRAPPPKNGLRHRLTHQVMASARPR